MLRRHKLTPRASVVAFACGLVACRGVLGIDDTIAEPASDASADSAQGAVVAADATTSGDAGASTDDATVMKDAARDSGCTKCIDGGCKVDNDCADPLRQRCSNGMWSTDASFVCIPRGVWGTLHADLPTGTVDFQEQYYGDVNHQPSAMLVRVQVDKGYTIYSVTIPNDAPVGTTIPFSPAQTTNVFVSFADDALGASKGGWNGAGTLTLTAMGTASGDRIAGSFSGTLTELGTNATAPFNGEIGVTVP